MPDAPENNDDRAPEGDGPSETVTQTEAVEAPPAEDAAPPEAQDAPANGAPSTPDGPVSEAVAESAGDGDAQPEAAAEPAPEPAAEAETAPQPERPAIGPVIIAEAPPPGTEEPSPSRRSRGAQPRQGQDGEKPRRRRRRSAAERHRGVFFARLSELRRAERQAAAAGTSDGEAPESPEEAAASAAPAEEVVAEPQAAEAPAPDAAQEGEAAEAQPEIPQVAAEAQAEGDEGAPAAEQPEPAEPAEQHEQPRPQGQRSAPPQVSRPRLISAIERVGGPEVVQEALAPKQDEQGERLKWAQVCSDAARGLQPGDPAFAAWVRLAATPVRDVRGAVNDMLGIVEEPRGHRRGGARRGGGGGRRERPGEWGGEGRARPSEVANFGRDGGLRTKIRIVGDDEEDRRQRDERRKAQREAKRAAERERLARLGY